MLTAAGEPVARAACRYRAELDSRGVDRWRGRLHRIVPPGAVGEGSYRLQFPEGEQGEIRVDGGDITGEVVPFEGIGVRPLLPL
ncbi:MAG: hypothetical protein U0531_00905 [Dehalococcoidia bacterium]